MRVDETHDGFVGSHACADEDGDDDREACVALRPRRAKCKGNSERYCGERVSDVVDQVGKQSDAVA